MCAGILRHRAAYPAHRPKVLNFVVEPHLRGNLAEVRRRVARDELPLLSLLQAEPLQFQAAHLSFQEYYVAHVLTVGDKRLATQKPWQWSAFWANVRPRGSNPSPLHRALKTRPHESVPAGRPHGQREGGGQAGIGQRLGADALAKAPDLTQADGRPQLPESLGPQVITSLVERIRDATARAPDCWAGARARCGALPRYSISH
mgnify:CR=1 FL=1